MLDNRVWLWHLDVVRNVNFLDVRHMDLFHVGNVHWDVLVDRHSFFVVSVVVLGLVLRDFVSEIVAAVALVTTEVMSATEVVAAEVDQAALVLLLGGLFSLDGLLLLVLCLLLRGNA